jgi:hypothetical protein
MQTQIEKKNPGITPVDVMTLCVSHAEHYNSALLLGNSVHMMFELYSASLTRQIQFNEC